MIKSIMKWLRIQAQPVSLIGCSIVILVAHVIHALIVAQSLILTLSLLGPVALAMSGVLSMNDHLKEYGEGAKF